MFGQVILINILLLASSVFTIKCNNAITPSALPITILDSATNFDATTPPTSYSCVSFKFTCSNSNPACTALQQQNNEILNGYSIVASQACSKLSSVMTSIIGAPVCCTTNLCNKVFGSTRTNIIISAPINNITALGTGTNNIFSTPITNNTAVVSNGTNTIVSAPITNNTAVGSVSGKTAGASSISSQAGFLAVVAIVAYLL